LSIVIITTNGCKIYVSHKLSKPHHNGAALVLSKILSQIAAPPVWSVNGRVVFFCKERRKTFTLKPLKAQIFAVPLRRRQRRHEALAIIKIIQHEITRYKII
jgi:hypothetical protein